MSEPPNPSEPFRAATSGASRWVRAAIGLLLLLDVMLALRGLLAWAPPAEPLESDWVHLIAHSRPLLGGFTLIALWSLLRFARGTFELLTGSLGVMAAIVMLRAHAVALGPDESLALIGVAGWLVGSAAGRLQPSDPSHRAHGAMWTMGAATLATLVLGLVARLARDTRSFFDASSLSSFPWAPGEQSIEPWAVLPVVLVALSSLVASRGRARLRAPLAVAAVLVAAAGWSPGLM